MESDLEREEFKHLIGECIAPASLEAYCWNQMNYFNVEKTKDDSAANCRLVVDLDKVELR